MLVRSPRLKVACWRAVLAQLVACLAFKACIFERVWNLCFRKFEALERDARLFVAGVRPAAASIINRRASARVRARWPPLRFVRAVVGRSLNLHPASSVLLL